MTEETVREVVTVGEIATFLGCNNKTVYDLIKSGELPGAVHLGRVIRVHKPTVVEWLSGRRELPRPRKKR